MHSNSSCIYTHFQSHMHTYITRTLMHTPIHALTYIYREKDAAEKRRKKEKKEFDWLQERNMHIHKDLANKDREQRQKSKPVWQRYCSSYTYIYAYIISSSFIVIDFYVSISTLYCIIRYHVFSYGIL